MRWKAIYLILGISLVLGIFYYFFLDHVLEGSIERSLELVTGAKVEVDRLHLNLFDLTLTIDRIQIANPHDTWRNLIETGKIRVQLARNPLFSGKVVMEDISLAGLMLDTPRRTDGQLRRRLLPGPFGKAQAKLNRDIASIPLLDSGSLQNEVNLNKDKLLSSYRFQTTLSAADIQDRINNAGREWNANLARLDETKQKLQQIDTRLRELTNASIKSLPELKQNLKTVEDLNQTISTLGPQINEVQSSYQKEFSDIGGDIGDLASAADHDYHELLKLAKLPDFEQVNIGEIIFGEALLNESSTFINLVDQLQAYVPAGVLANQTSPAATPETTAQNTPRYPRGGQDIIFPGRRTYPNFLIRHLAVSAQGPVRTFLKGYSADATLMGFTTEPAIYGKPMELAVSAASPGHSYLNLKGSMNHITSQIDDRFNLQIQNINLPEINFADRPYLPERISLGDAKLLTDLAVQHNRFDLHIRLDSPNIKWDFGAPERDHHPESGNLIAEILQQTLTGLDRLQIDYRLQGQDHQLHMNVSTNLDQLLKERFDAAIGAKVTQFKAELQLEVNRLLDTKQKELQAQTARYQTEVSAKINEVQVYIAREQQLIAAQQRDLEAKIKAEQDRLTNAAAQKQQELQQQGQETIDKKQQQLEEEVNKLKNQLLPGGKF